MEEILFRRVLIEAQRARELVCIYSDPTDLERFSVGYVTAVRDEDCTLEEFDPEGQPDGVTVMQLEDILRIDVGDRYSNQILVLLENQADLEAEMPDGEEIGIPPVDCLRSVLERALAMNAVVCCSIDSELDSLSIYGTVKRLSDYSVQLNKLTNDGEPDGVTTLPLSLIRRLRVDGRDERKIMLLNKHRTHLYL